MTSFQKRFDVEVLTAVIARSQIVFAPAAFRRVRHLPACFEAVDIAILDWIAAEDQRAGRSIVRM